MKRALAAMLAIVVLLTGVRQARADDWPSRPIKLIVPFAAGGTADLLGRVFAQALSESLGQQLYVENRGGAGGITASAQVARMEPDGYTLLVSGVASHVIAPALSRKPEYDPIRQFTHIAYWGGPPIVWVAHPSLGVRNLDQLLARIRGTGEPLSYGSPGVGTQGHLVAAYLARKLDSILALDYPQTKMEILVVSDGSTDRTDSIARSYAPQNVRLLRVAQGGKALALNAGVAASSQPVLVFTDVRQTLAPNSLALLLENLSDPSVGAASGELVDWGRNGWLESDVAAWRASRPRRTYQARAQEGIPPDQPGETARPLEFTEQEKVFDPQKIYGDAPNPTQL